MTEETISQGGRSAKRAVEDAGFSEELKMRLQARLEDSQFRSENPAAFATLNMPVRRALILAVTTADGIGSPALEKVHVI